MSDLRVSVVCGAVVSYRQTGANFFCGFVVFCCQVGYVLALFVCLLICLTAIKSDEWILLKFLEGAEIVVGNCTEVPGGLC